MKYLYTEINYSDYIKFKNKKKMYQNIIQKIKIKKYIIIYINFICKK